jgi:response regulator NasT
MAEAELRILIVGDGADRRQRIAGVAIGLGHAVVSADAEVDRIGALTRTERPDVALVVVGDSAGSLATIERIVKEAACPVIAILDVEDRAFVDQAARLGIFAYIADGMEGELQGSIDIALRRFAEYHALEGAFGRRALTERAKGILMERHDLSEQQAFNMLRDHARSSSRKVVDVAQSVVESRGLLSGREHSSSGEPDATA